MTTFFGDDFKKKLKETAQCSICLDIIAYAHNFVPCGDSFCYSCIIKLVKTKTTKCPLCRVRFNRDILVHNKLLDNMIGETFKEFEAEEFDALKERISIEKRAKKSDAEKLRVRTRPKRSRELVSLLRSSSFHSGAIIDRHLMTTRSRNRVSYFC
jgi:hypothetical protein